MSGSSLLVHADGVVVNPNVPSGPARRQHWRLQIAAIVVCALAISALVAVALVQLAGR